MIREVLREAWSNDPLAVVVSVPLTIAAVVVGWAILVVVLVMGGAS